MKLNDFSEKLQKELLSIARSILPDGGCLDDDWSEYNDRIAVAVIEKYPELFDAEEVEIFDELIANASK